MPADKRADIELPPEEAFRFLHRLASDDEFRAQVEANPEAALGESGISVPAGTPRSPVTLPAREEIEAMAAAIQGRRRFRVGSALREPGIVAESERPLKEFGPPPDDSGSPPAEFGPPPGEFGPPPSEFGAPPTEFGPPPDEESKEGESE